MFYSSSIINRFEKAKEKHEFYSSSIPPHTTMETLRKRWVSLNTIQAIQSVHHAGDPIEDQANKLASSNAA